MNESIPELNYPRELKWILLPYITGLTFFTIEPTFRSFIANSVKVLNALRISDLKKYNNIISAMNEILASSFENKQNFLHQNNIISEGFSVSPDDPEVSQRIAEETDELKRNIIVLDHIFERILREVKGNIES